MKFQINKFIHLPRYVKYFLTLLIDISILILSMQIAIILGSNSLQIVTNYGESFVISSFLKFLPYIKDSVWLVFFISPIIGIAIFNFHLLYSEVVRFVNYRLILSVLKAVLIHSLTLFSIIFILNIDFSKSILAIYFFICLVNLMGSRLIMRFILLRSKAKTATKNQRKVLIFGAGDAGRYLAQSIVNLNELDLVGFSDDESSFHGRRIMGLPIFNPTNLINVVKDFSITEIFLAIPSANSLQRQGILDRLRMLPVSVKTLPSMVDIVNNKLKLSDVKDLDINDLLGRDPAYPDKELLMSGIAGKKILITGAGGSIGSEICRQIIYYKPKQIILLEINEYFLYQIHNECINLLNKENSSLSGLSVVPILSSVHDYESMQNIINKFKPDIIYHAAAYKHVPMVEHNPIEGIKNNVVGTYITARCAVESKVKRFVLISTDKAVRPTNIMGASKRLSEMILQGMANIAKINFSIPNKGVHKNITRFSIVRFGNVLGSSGSVVPLFREQLRSGGPLTLTHKDITRYFMTISEAAQLVLQASLMIDSKEKNAEVYVLDMGEPVKIYDLAVRMIELSGNRVKYEANQVDGIEIKLIGLRPGEKLYEELLIGNKPIKTLHSRIFKASEEFLSWDLTIEILEKIIDRIKKNDVEGIRNILKSSVNGYKASSRVDWTYLEKTKSKKVF